MHEKWSGSVFLLKHIEPVYLKSVHFPMNAYRSILSLYWNSSMFFPI